MDASELKNKTIDELQKTLDDKRGELDKFKFEMGFGKNKNVKQGSVIKKDIARILTTINEKRHGTN